MLEHRRKHLMFDLPGVYRIRVGGCIEGISSDSFAGMAIAVDPISDEECITTLMGQLLDQAALAGILSAIHDLSLPLLSVERL